MLRSAFNSTRFRSFSTGKLVVPVIDFGGMYGTEKQQMGTVSWLQCNLSVATCYF